MQWIRELERLSIVASIMRGTASGTDVPSVAQASRCSGGAEGRLVRVALQISAISLSLSLAPAVAIAVPVWTDWTLVDATSATGTLEGGRGVTFSSGTAAIQGINPASTGGAFYAASPAVPGLASGESPESVRMVTASPHPGLLDAGAMIFEVALDFAPDAETVIGLRDLWNTSWYSLELLDANRTPLSRAELQFATYDLSYPSFVADLGVTFDSSTGLIRSDNVHNLGSSYSHSGLVLFTGLPGSTRYVRLVSGAGFPQGTEGISFYFGAQVPEPSTVGTVGLGLAAFGWIRGRLRLRG